jgi:hypothetical protein
MHQQPDNHIAAVLLGSQGPYYLYDNAYIAVARPVSFTAG